MVTASTPACSNPSTSLQCGATQGPRHDVPLLTVRVGDSDKTHAGNIRQHAGMIAAHDADADDADFQWVSRYPDCLTHDPQGSPSKLPPDTLPSMAKADRSTLSETEPEHVLLLRLTGGGHL